MHLGPFGVLWITGAVCRVGCPVVGGCRALAVAGSSSGESASRLPALLPLHPAGFSTSGGGISTGGRRDGEVPPRREHVDEEGERLSHSGCRWCDDPVAPRLVGRLRDVLAATVGVTVDRGQRQVLHRQPAGPPRGQGSADADNRARSFLIKSCWQSDTVLAES